MFSVCYCFMHTLVFIVGAYSTWAFVPIMFMNWSVILSDFSNSRALIATRSCRELVMCLVINLALFMLFFFFFFTLNGPSRMFSHFFRCCWVVLLPLESVSLFLSLFFTSASVSTFVPPFLFVCVLYLVRNVQSQKCKVMLLKCVMWCIIQNSMLRHKCVLCRLDHVPTIVVIHAYFPYLGGELASTDV